MSAPASACTRTLLDERSNGFVIDDFIADQKSVVAVAGVGIERDVENDADVETGFLHRARCPADQVAGVEGFARVFGSERRVGEGKEGDRRDAELFSFARGVHDEVDGEAFDAGHGGDGLALRLALDDEQRPDEIAGRKRALGDEPARPARFAISAQPRRRIGAVPGGGKVGTGIAVQSGCAGLAVGHRKVPTGSDCGHHGLEARRLTSRSGPGGKRSVLWRGFDIETLPYPL